MSHIQDILQGNTFSSHFYSSREERPNSHSVSLCQSERTALLNMVAIDKILALFSSRLSTRNTQRALVKFRWFKVHRTCLWKWQVALKVGESNETKWNLCLNPHTGSKHASMSKQEGEAESHISVYWKVGGNLADVECSLGYIWAAFFAKAP